MRKYTPPTAKVVCTEIGASILTISAHNDVIQRGEDLTDGSCYADTKRKWGCTFREDMEEDLKTFSGLELDWGETSN